MSSSERELVQEISPRERDSGDCVVLVPIGRGARDTRDVVCGGRLPEPLERARAYFEE